MKLLKTLLPFIVVTVIAFLVYAIPQHIMRKNANHPQLEMAQQAAEKMNKGEDLKNIVGSEKVDINSSLAPFTVIYDNLGTVLASSATLNGMSPIVPKGVLDYANSHGQDVLTWQPQDGVRIAAVVRRVTGNYSGYILAGRNFRDVEKKEQSALFVALALWIILITAAAVYSLKKTKQQVKEIQ